jgi:hypothetical protein
VVAVVVTVVVIAMALARVQERWEVRKGQGQCVGCDPYLEAVRVETLLLQQDQEGEGDQDQEGGMCSAKRLRS